MPRSASWMAARKPALRLCAAFAGPVCGLMLSACKSGVAERPAPSPAPAPAEATTVPRVEPKLLRLRPEPTFELPEDVVIDPAEEQRAMKANCCEELPESEIKSAKQAEEPKR